jgi:hypothetical protein
MQLSRGSAGAGVAAGLVCGTSFSSVLAATVPESAAFASFGALIPLLFLNARFERPFPWWEALIWGGIGALAFGLTVTQATHWGIALGVRLLALRRSGAAIGKPLAKAALAAVLGGVLVLGGAWLQTQRYPRTQPFYAQDVIGDELRWTRPEAYRQEPLRQAGRLLSHFALLDFAAPSPAYSSYLVKRGFAHYWTLSIEEAGLAQWSPAQLLLGGALLACVLFAIAVGRWRDERLLAPALCVAIQLALHFLYGREYVLYSPHWHGVLVALLVAATWNGLAERGRRWLPVAGGILAAALLANNLAVMQQVYREVEAGLDLQVRDLNGRVLSKPKTP